MNIFFVFQCNIHYKFTLISLTCSPKKEPVSPSNHLTPASISQEPAQFLLGIFPNLSIRYFGMFCRGKRSDCTSAITVVRWLDGAFPATGDNGEIIVRSPRRVSVIQGWPPKIDHRNDNNISKALQCSYGSSLSFHVLSYPTYDQANIVSDKFRLSMKPIF